MFFFVPKRIEKLEFWFFGLFYEKKIENLQITRIKKSWFYEFCLNMWKCLDPEAPPVLECAYICDNLLCDAIGRTPSTR